MSALVAIALAGLATYALRVAPIALLSRWGLRPELDRALRFATPGVLAALLANSIVQGGAMLTLITPSPELLAGAAGGLVAWRTRSMVATMAVAIAAYWLLSALWGSGG